MHHEFNVKRLRDNVFFIMMFLFLIIVTHILLQTGMSCTDSKGCLRSWCKMDYLNDNYARIVQDQTTLCNSS